LTDEGLARRYGDHVPRDVRELCDHELSLVAELRYEPYFLTVYDIVAFARPRRFFARVAARPPIPPSATRSALPKSIQRAFRR
jgi:hypothetical protein